MSSSRSERRLWRVDLNDIHVTDHNGHPLEVIMASARLDGRITVMVQITTSDEARAGVDSEDKSPRQRANAPGHGHRGKDPQ